MRTLLLGTDFAYNVNGDLVPIEINTNVGMDLYTIENRDEIFQLDQLKDFITSNNFTSVVYIGGLYLLDLTLKSFCESNSLEYTYYQVTNGVTIPFVEDNINTLIIRSAYDSSAIVDEEYCKNKVNFLNLIKTSTFKSQFAFRDINNEIVNNITSFPNYGDHPNFILKSIFPKYNKEIYPKFYRITSQDELNIVLQNVTDMNFLMEFHYNPNKLFDDHIQIFRSLNLLLPPNLNSIPIGKYTKLTSRKVDNLSTFDPSSFELNYIDRIKYITDTNGISKPKLMNDDKVFMADGTFKTGENLQVGDIIKTIHIPNIDDQDDIIYATQEFNIPYDEFLSGVTYTTNEVTYKNWVDKLVDITKITFTDGSTWEDTQNSIYLIVRNDIVKFVNLSDGYNNLGLKIGDKIILLDVSVPTAVVSLLKEVEKIEIIKTMFGGWEITVQDDHVFLTQAADNISTYVTVEHNIICSFSSCPCTVCARCNKGYICCPNKTCTSGNCTAGAGAEDCAFASTCGCLGLS